MNKNFTIYFLATILFFSCSSQDEKSNKDSAALNHNKSSEMPMEYDNLIDLENQKNNIDAAIKNQQLALSIYEKHADKTSPELFIKDKEISPEEMDNLEFTYNLFKDDKNQILAASSFPYIQSGDGFIQNTYYFTMAGNTFAFERQTNFFNSGCTSGVAYETKIYFFNREHIAVDSSYKLVDEEGKSLNKKDCNMMYEEPLNILDNREEVLKNFKIEHL